MIESIALFVFGLAMIVFVFWMSVEGNKIKIKNIVKLLTSHGQHSDQEAVLIAERLIEIGADEKTINIFAKSSLREYLCHDEMLYVYNQYESVFVNPTTLWRFRAYGGYSYRAVVQKLLEG